MAETLQKQVFKNRAPYLFLDEIGKMSPRDQSFLLNLMETGMVSEMKYGNQKHLFLQRATFLDNYDAATV